MYEMTEWKARKGTDLNRFEKSQETARSVILENVPTSVTEPGTPFSIAGMNKIERGIFDAHEGIAQESNARQHGDASLAQAIADESQARQHGDASLAQAIADESQARADAIQAHNADTTAHAYIRAILNNLMGLPQWDSDSHILTFRAQDGATLVVDLPLEALTKDIDFDPATKEIIIIKHDGSQIRVSVADLVDVYTGSLGTHIQITIGENNQINAALRAGSIGENELSAALLDTLVRKSQKGAANGVATLDANGLVPLSQLPEIVGSGGSGTQIFALETSGTVSAAPEGSRVGDLILNSYTAAKTIGGISVAVGGLAEITQLNPFTCKARGSIRGAAGINGTNGARGSVIWSYPGVLSPSVTSIGTSTLAGNANNLPAKIDDFILTKSLTTLNLSTWTARTAAQANTWGSVCYGNGLFVAVAWDGAVRAMTSPDGITWTARTAIASDWSSVCYGNGLFVAVANDGTSRVMTSPDGITWTARTAAEVNSWRSVCYGNGLFVAVARVGTNRVMTSPDGITWTSRAATAAEASSWASVCYGNGLFVAVAWDGAVRAMTSPDGITWTARTAIASDWSSVCYGNGLFVAVAQGGTNRVITSPDGITWTVRTAAQVNKWFSVCYSNGLFVAVASDGTSRVMTSPDGITWTARTAAEVNSWRSVCYGNGLFVAVAIDGTNRVMTAVFDVTVTANAQLFRITNISGSTATISHETALTGSGAGGSSGTDFSVGSFPNFTVGAILAAQISNYSNAAAMEIGASVTVRRNTSCSNRIQLGGSGTLATGSWVYCGGDTSTGQNEFCLVRRVS